MEGKFYIDAEKSVQRSPRNLWDPLRGRPSSSRRGRPPCSAQAGRVPSFPAAGRVRSPCCVRPRAAAAGHIRSPQRPVILIPPQLASCPCNLRRGRTRTTTAAAGRVCLGLPEVTSAGHPTPCCRRSRKEGVRASFVRRALPLSSPTPASPRG